MTLTEEKLTKAEQAADLLSFDLRELRDQIPEGSGRDLTVCAISLCGLVERALVTIRQVLKKDAGQ